MGGVEAEHDGGELEGQHADPEQHAEDAYHEEGLAGADGRVDAALDGGGVPIPSPTGRRLAEFQTGHVGHSKLTLATRPSPSVAAA